MTKRNSAYIAVSLDGFIADKNDGIEWLDSVTIPEGEDMGYVSFTDRIDALIMGRNSYETVLGFDIEWPYNKPVYVLSSSLTEVPEELEDKVFLVNGTLSKVLEQVYAIGHTRLYIDGGKTVQSFLKEDLIDEMIITRFPILLGGGASLFGDLDSPLDFELVNSKVYVDSLVQCSYERKR